MTFPAILFDCDGVLVDSEIIYIDVERQHLERIGLNYDLDDYQKRFSGLTSTDFFKFIDADHRSLGKGPLPASFADDLDKASKERLDKELSAIQGIEAVLQAYRGAKAVASSSRLTRLEGKLRQTGLHRFFDPHIYSGEQVASGKPAPDLFLFAAEKLAVTPTDCLVIEDSVNGVLAGRAAGMTVWGFTGGGHAGEALADRLIEAGAEQVIQDHHELARRLV